MQHRILVLGNTGMLGHMVEHVLGSDERFDVRSVGRDACDASSPIPPLILRGGEGGWSPDSIINCIGITARHINDADPASVARAIVVNAAFPHALAAAAAAHGAKVIHMSTDGVFSGNRTELYAESDTPDATDTYGRTKILGESRAPNVLNIRCSIIGPSPLKREGLWEWVAQQPDGATISGYTNHLWHGATTRQFAELCTSIIADGRFATLRAAGPVFHFTPNEPVTKYDLVCAMRDALGKRLTITPVSHAQPVTRVLVSRGGALPRQDVRAVLRACVETRTSL